MHVLRQRRTKNILIRNAELTPNYNGEFVRVQKNKSFRPIWRLSLKDSLFKDFVRGTAYLFIVGTVLTALFYQYVWYAASSEDIAMFFLYGVIEVMYNIL